jgi:hypothetical protein
MVIFGCNKDDFSPLGDFQNKLVVNCILDSRSNKQFVKIQNSFLANYEQSQNANKLPKNIIVKLSSGGENFYFKDTAISSINNYQVMYLPNLILNRGSDYTITTQADGYPTVSSTIKIPSISNVDVSFRYTANEILVQVNNNKAKGFSFYLFFDYEVIENDKKTMISAAVPYLILQNTDNSSEEYLTYSSLTKSNSASFSFDNLLYVLTKIKPKTGQQIKIYWGKAIAYSLEENLYNYYMSVNGFNDPYSIRLDQPFYANINQGYGIFGSIVVDSSRYRIPIDIIKAFDYIDGQE